jgi:hypothetical protein
LADGWAAFLVTDPSVQNLPDEPAKAMGDYPDCLIVSEARYIPSVEDLEDASFVFDRRVGGLIENAPQVTVALWRPVTMAHARALVIAGAGTDP